MYNMSSQPWFDLTWKSWMLMGEASMVVWLRTSRLMMGGSLAEREAWRMVSEKVAANMTLGGALMMGGPRQSAHDLGKAALAHYSKPILANRKRLSRS